MMIWYVAIVAILNLALGYALAVFLRSGRAQFALPSGHLTEAAEFEDELDSDDEEDWES